MQNIHLTSTVPEHLAEERLDVAVAALFPEYSRSQHQQWIKSGCVQVDQIIVQKTRYLVQTDQKLSIEAELAVQTQWAKQKLSLSIVYEDDALLVVDKPAGLVVHPGAGNPDNTMVNALLYHDPELEKVPRAGIIHRLDKETSGLLVVAKTLSAHYALIKEMQERQIKREYRAIVYGRMIAGGTIDLPIGRHKTHRTKMAVIDTGKEAITHYRVLERFFAHTLLSVQLETGRTHQIRVHFCHRNYPLIGDPVYKKRAFAQSKNLADEAQIAVQQFPRQALHAYRLGFTHPITNEPMSWTSELPTDMQNLIEVLRKNT